MPPPRCQRGGHPRGWPSNRPARHGCSSRMVSKVRPFLPRRRGPAYRLPHLLTSMIDWQRKHGALPPQSITNVPAFPLLPAHRSAPEGESMPTSIPTLSRRHWLSMIGKVAGGSVMYQAMSSLGYAQESNRCPVFLIRLIRPIEVCQNPKTSVPSYVQITEIQHRHTTDCDGTQQYLPF